MDIKIAAAYHKQSTIICAPYIIPIQVGKALTATSLNIQKDDEGDNISYKNPWYCELTALYWLWRNTKADYKGLIHYRRAFTTHKFFPIQNFRLHLTYTLRRFFSIWLPYHSAGVLKRYKIYEKEEFTKDIHHFSNSLEAILQHGYNVIAPYPNRLYMNIERTISWECGGYNLNLLSDIIKKHYPFFFPYYTKAQKGTCFHSANMEIMDNQTFDEYCTLLFGILEKHEEEVISRNYLIDISKEKAYSRMSGYLGEIITNAFIIYCKENKKVKILPTSIFLGKE